MVYLISCIMPFSGKQVAFKLKQGKGTFKNISDALEKKYIKKVHEIYIGSSNKKIVGKNDDIYNYIDFNNVLLTGYVRDIIFVFFENENIHSNYNFKDIMNDSFRESEVKYIVKNIINKIIINNVCVNESFNISRKKRKNIDKEDTTYVWKSNPYVIFHSEKKARLFLEYEANK